MKPQPNLSEAEFIAKANSGEKIISIYASLLSDLSTPVLVYAKLKDFFKDCFLFESVHGGEKLGRYSFVGANSLLSYSSYQNDSKNPYDDLEKILNSYALANADTELKFFHKGLVGFFSFESVKRIETSLDLKTSHLPESFFYLAGDLVVFDHVEQRLFLIVNNLIDDLSEAVLKLSYEKALRALEKLLEIIQNSSKLDILPASLVSNNINHSEFKSNTSEEEFKKMVAKAKEHILEGDIFQAVLSQRFYVEKDLDPLTVYRCLRNLNPSPYLYLMNIDLSKEGRESFSIVGSSPEMLVKSVYEVGENAEIGVPQQSQIVAREQCSRWAELRPIAGTYRRGISNAEDTALAEKLLADTKEIAEHVMLVDLGRNDLGRVSENGSIYLAENMVVEKYSHVLHIVSSVKGKLRKDITNIALLKACFPAGTLTGAPKVEAIKIISSLEKEARGPYGGCLGYIGFDGTLNVAITIRTIIVEKNLASIQCGAGIVADSDPDSEYRETFNKAAALMQVLNSL